jgi:hypothetical protein
LLSLILSSALPLRILIVRSRETTFGKSILDAVAKLSPKHRAVIVLKDLDDLQYSEIAETLECSIGTVMSQLFHARRKLRILLRPLYESLLSRQRHGRRRGQKVAHLLDHDKHTNTSDRRSAWRGAFFAQYPAPDVDRSRPTCLPVCRRNLRVVPGVTN